MTSKPTSPSVLKILSLSAFDLLYRACTQSAILGFMTGSWSFFLRVKKWQSGHIMNSQICRYLRPIQEPQRQLYLMHNNKKVLCWAQQAILNA
jgi:hypothetical protein